MATQSSPARPGHLAALLEELAGLRTEVLDNAARRLEPYRLRYPDGFSPDAHNLASYLALRSRDLRPLQERLVEAGVSSLGRGESQVQTNLNRVIGILSNALGIAEDMDFPDEGPGRLQHHTDVLFGRRQRNCHTRIMVTLPPQAATCRELLDDLVASGMDCARINCAHDGPQAWQGMIENIRAAEARTGARIRIFMDLGGHKIRTGPVETGKPVRHLKVCRDPFGHMVAPAQVVLTGDPDAQGEVNAAPGVARLPVPPGLLDCVQARDRLRFRDARDKKRRLVLRERLSAGEWLAECSRSAYLTPGTQLRLERAGKQRSDVSQLAFHVGRFAGKPAAIRLYRGDQLLLRRDTRPGCPGSGSGKSAHPPEIGCSHAEVIDQLQPGHAVWIDDGKLGCVVEQVNEQGALLQVTHAGPRGVRMRADKGINVPDTVLPLPPLTDKDRADLDFVCAHADMVGLSFVRELGDVDTLRHELAARGNPRLPIVIKVETAAAVKNLPDLLLGSIGQHTLGVMIARGDLAVELGSVRMAEIQEEILWLCEAAHVPVIWATQVLETLARDGIIDRPEITDAAMSVRAECVMLNKGPFITDAVVILHDILSRMDAHQYKKISRLRRLHF